MMSRVEIMQKGIELTSGDRSRTHGDFFTQHQATAEAWRWWLKIRFNQDLELKACDVAEMMCLLKKSRKAHGEFNLDDYLDDTVYAAGAGECAQQALKQVTWKFDGK